MGEFQVEVLGRMLLFIKNPNMWEKGEVCVQVFGLETVRKETTWKTKA
jgi:hypothetical protein